MPKSMGRNEMKQIIAYAAKQHQQDLDRAKQHPHRTYTLPLTEPNSGTEGECQLLFRGGGRLTCRSPSTRDCPAKRILDGRAIGDINSLKPCSQMVHDSTIITYLDSLPARRAASQAQQRRQYQDGLDDIWSSLKDL